MSNTKDILEYLSSLEFFGIKLGLEQTLSLLELLGNPQENLKFIHVAGTNGKGSVCAFLDSALNAAGYKTGFYSSPHLIKVNERFRVNGTMIPDDTLRSLAEEVKEAVEKMRKEGASPTYFEVTTAIGFLYFCRENCDFVILETGMGGRLDATNTVNPVCSIITGIALEHQQYLGDSLEKIAFEKAGIIKHGKPVFTGVDMPKEALKVIREKADQEHSALTEAIMPGPMISCSFENDRFIQEFTASDNTVLKLSLPGFIQRKNAELAWAVLKYLETVYHFSLEKAKEGMKRTFWPGRIQFISPNFILDGAHNPEGAEALAASLQEIMPGRKFSIIFGNFSDKETVAILRQLCPIAEEFIFIPIPGEYRKSRSPEELQGILECINPSLPSVAAENFESAVKLPKKSELTIAAGSLYLTGTVLAESGTAEKVFRLY